MPLLGELGDAIRANDLEDLLRILKTYETRTHPPYVEQHRDARIKGAVSYARSKLGAASGPFVDAIKSTLAIRGKPPKKVSKKTQ